MSDYGEAREAGARAYARQLYMGAGGGFRGPQIDAAMEPLMPGVLKDSNGVIDAFLSKLSETHAVVPRDATEDMMLASRSIEPSTNWRDNIQRAWAAMIQAASGKE